MDSCREKKERNAGGKTRKYYFAAERGKLILEEARIRIREMVDEAMA